MSKVTASAEGPQQYDGRHEFPYVSSIRVECCVERHLLTFCVRFRYHHQLKHVVGSFGRCLLQSVIASSGTPRSQCTERSGRTFWKLTHTGQWLELRKKLCLMTAESDRRTSAEISTKSHRVSELRGFSSFTEAHSRRVFSASNLGEFDKKAHVLSQSL